MSDKERLERTFKRVHKEIARLSNGTEVDLNTVLELHGFPQIIEEYDNDRNRELHMSRLENHLENQEVSNR